MTTEAVNGQVQPLTLTPEMVEELETSSFLQELEGLSEGERIEAVAWWNIQGAEKFAQKARELLIASGQARGLTKTGWETDWLQPSDVTWVAKHFGIEAVFFYHENHAYLILEPPKLQEDGRYKMVVYNPMEEGEREMMGNILSNEGDTIFTTFEDLPEADDLGDSLRKVNYNLKIRVQEAPEAVGVAAGKVSAVQVAEAHNCTLHSIYHAAVALAMKPGPNKFKEVGLKEIRDKAGVKLVTYEEVFPKEAAVAEKITVLPKRPARKPKPTRRPKPKKPEVRGPTEAEVKHSLKESARAMRAIMDKESRWRSMPPETKVKFFNHLKVYFMGIGETKDPGERKTLAEAVSGSVFGQYPAAALLIGKKLTGGEVLKREEAFSQWKDAALRIRGTLNTRPEFRLLSKKDQEAFFKDFATILFGINYTREKAGRVEVGESLLGAVLEKYPEVSKEIAKRIKYRRNLQK